MKYLEEYKLFESKQVGTIYHFTNLGSLHGMLSLGKVKLHTNDLKDIAEYSKYSGSFSATRKFDLKFDNIRITIDGTKLSNNFTIKPIHFFNTKRNRTNDFDDVKFDDGNDFSNLDDLRTLGGKVTRYSGDVNQMEERIFGKIGQSFDSKKYILQIDILKDYYDSWDDLSKTIITKLFNNINIVKKFKPYKK